MNPKIRTYNQSEVCVRGLLAEQVDIEEIAISLSRINRFSGHTLMPYNVADHSMRVALLVPDRLKLPALLHDAHEAYTGFGDVASPAKAVVKTIRKIERETDIPIAEHFGIEVQELWCNDVKRADRQITRDEQHYLECPPIGKIELMAVPSRQFPKPLDSVAAMSAFMDCYERYSRLYKELKNEMSQVP